MKEFRFRIILILAAFALSIYLLYPTYSDYKNSQYISEKADEIVDSIKVRTPQMSDADMKEILSETKDSIFSSNPSFKEDREKRI